MKNIPAFFVTTIHLSISDRLRVLWHGELIYRAEIEPDPGEFEITNVVVKIPSIRRGKAPSIGYEKTHPQRLR